MDIDVIKKLADEAGLGNMYERPKLQMISEDAMGFVRTGKLTTYGESIVKFANLVEDRVIGEII